MNHYRLAVFDMDGTILDTLRDLMSSANYALEKNAFPPRTLEEVRQFVGNGIHKLVERAVPAGTRAEDVEAVFADFGEHYREHNLDTTRPYEGIVELLGKLQAAGLQLAVVSNKVDYAVKELSEKFFPGLFDMAIGEKPGVAKKPAPDAVNEVLKTLDVPREQAVYIGDSEVDIQTARNAGLDELIVTWGFRDPAFLAAQGAKKLVNSPEELYKLLTE